MRSHALIRAVVDASALRHNLRQVRRVAPASRVMAVIKAKLIWIVGGVLVFAALYGVVVWSKKRSVAM